MAMPRKDERTEFAGQIRSHRARQILQALPMARAHRAMTRVYVLHPGMVRSASDGQWHYVDAKRLAALYGLRFDHCLVDWRESVVEVRRWAESGSHIHLFPREDGAYRALCGQPPKETT
jgi:hypothetical protein